MRWDWFGTPYDQKGVMGTPVGGTAAVHGLTGTRFDGTLTRIDFIGKNSRHPDSQVWDDDWNNFGPSFGLSWSIPYFGRNQTVFRAGYAVTYQGGGRTFSLLDGALGSIQGLRWSSNSNTYGLNWHFLADIAPPLPRGEILEPVELDARNVAVQVFERKYVNPYVQNFNVELQRELGANLTLEVRYTGSKGTKLYSQFALNDISLLRNNPEFLEAVRLTQAGGAAPLFDQMLMGLNVPGFGVVDGVTRTGSAALRASTNTRSQLANNDAGTVANFLNSTNAFTGENGGILRHGGLPEDYFVANPQFSGVTLNGNAGTSTYHSMVIQATKRMSHGFANQTSYTWSKAMGVSDGDGGAGAYRDVYNRRNDRSVLGFHRTHSFRTNGSYELPFGPNRRLLANAPGWVARIVERWQFGATGEWSSGAPLTISASTASFTQSTANTPMIVGSFPKSTGQVTPATDVPGAHYFEGFVQVDDPFGATLTTAQALNTRFTNRAIQDAAGNFVLINPGLGELGNLGTNWIEGPGSYTLDMNLIKRIRLDEQKEFELRVDAINVLNHSLGQPQYGHQFQQFRADHEQDRQSFVHAQRPAEFLKEDG